jgi:uncharacterized protein DUF4124
LNCLRLIVPGHYIMKPPISVSRALPKALIFALLVWVAFQPEPVFAKIYKYKDEHGKTHFTDDASRIPPRYRNKGAVKNFKGVNEPDPAPGTSSLLPSPASAGGGESSVQNKNDEGLSSQDEGLVKKTIQTFKVGIALGNEYKDNQPNFTNGRRAVNDIQSSLPLKESLARELAGTKVPELKEALGFLKQSIAVDQQTTSVGSGLRTRIFGIFRRLVNEGKQQSALIDKLEKALKNSAKKKAEAEKKKKEEAKKK